MGYMSEIEKRQANREHQEYLKERAKRKETLLSLRYMRLYRKALEKILLAVTLDNAKNIAAIALTEAMKRREN